MLHPWLCAASLALLTAHKLSISAIHLDTTTKSVQGTYENDTYGQFKIEYACGKDHRRKRLRLTLQKVQIKCR